MAGERQKRAARARFREVAADVMDVGRGYSDRQGASRVLDGAEELATKRATAAVEAGRPLRPHESRAIRREVLGQQVGRQAAEQPQRRRMTVDEWLEKMSPEERDEIEFSQRFKGLSEQAQDYVLHRRAALEHVLAADDLLAREAFDRGESGWEGSADVSDDDLEAGGPVQDESDYALEAKLEEIVADRLEAESEAVLVEGWEYDDLDEEEVEGQ